MMNEVGPNFIGYFKHLASELLTDSEMVLLPFPEFKKERLKMILDESVDCIIRETDTSSLFLLFCPQHMEIKDQIIALSCQLQNSDECIEDRSRKRKALSSPSMDSGNADILNQKAVEKVYGDTRALQESAEIDLKALEKYSAEAQAKLDKLEEGLEEFLNIIFSKCRPMTNAEKERLGWQIKKLPEKALDRVVGIILHHSSGEPMPSEVFVDLEELDDTKLWRLYYYVQNVLGANKLSSCSLMPFPLM